MSQVDLHGLLKQGTRTSAFAGRHRLSGGFVVSQVAVAVVLLVGAGLLARSFQRLVTVDPGFQPDNVLAFQLSVPRAGFSDAGQRAGLYRQVLERLETLPGVEAVGASTNLPLHPAYATDSFVIQGRPQPNPGEVPRARYDSISAQYFQTIGVPLLQGRFFNEQDKIGRPGVVIINETMAKLYWPDEDPIGQRIILGSTLNDGSPAHFEIVGIVAGQRDTRLDAPLEPYLYVPYRQQALRYMSFVLRTSVDPLSLIGAVRKEVAAVTKEEAPFEFASMTQLLRRSVASSFAITLVLGFFALVALGLAALGIYGMLSYLVRRRTHEIGVRMAIGARHEDVLGLVLRQGCGFAAMGLGIGLIVALAGTHVLSSQLYEVSAIDAPTFLGVSVVLSVVALLACYAPARRATKVDPMVALRCE
jgi:putative ABC transport system permease protein